MPSFDEIGLRQELLQSLEDDEISTPTALQQAVVPTLRRGSNVIARASAGSGKTLAYLLGVLDRLQDGTGDDADEADPAPRVIILTPTNREAERAGLVATRYAEPLGLRVCVLGAGWGTAVEEAGVVVAAAGDIMDAISSSGVKLDRVEAVVVDGASEISQIGHWDRVDTLMDLLPRDSQRILITARLDAEIEDLAARRVKKALRYPAEPAVPEDVEPAPPAGTLGYVLALDREKVELLALQLRGREPDSSPPVLFCRTDERAAEIAEQLAVRGFLVGEPGDAESDIAMAPAGVTLTELADELEGDVGQTISFDVPADAATLHARHAGDDDAVILIEPRELAHLKEIARQANLRARSVPVPALSSRSADELRAFRQQIRTAIEQEDLSAQILVLEPLLQEFSAVEVAAAAAAIVRRRAAAPPAEEVQAKAPAGARKERSASPGAAPVTWARLFVSIGSRDEVRPGDLVGALAGESGIPGSRIGKIEIRDSFSIVEVQSDVADQVIRAVNGTTMKGRSLRVDYDRGGPARRPDARKGPPRRTSRQPPR